MSKIVGGQKKLRGPIAVPVQAVIVLPNEISLPDRSSRLQVGQIVGALFQTEQTDSGANRSARNEHHPPS